MPFLIESRAKPVLKWAGGKSALLPQLLSLFPRKFERYFEPFLGGAAVLLSLEGCPALANDGNRELIHLYRVIRDEPERLMRTLDRFSSYYCEEFFYRLRNRLPVRPVERAARTIFLNKTGYNGLYRQNSTGTFNVPFGKRPGCPRLYEKENLLRVSAKLNKVGLRDWDFEMILERAGHGDFVYCDPPYEPLSPTSSFNGYFKGRFSRADQLRLKEAAVRAAKRGAVVAISNSSAPFILELYRGWRIEWVSARRAINSDASGRGAVREVCILIEPGTRRKKGKKVRLTFARQR